MDISRLRHGLMCAAAAIAAAMPIMFEPVAAAAETVKIAVVSASDLAGRYVVGETWAAQLERMLRAKGYDVSMSVTATPGVGSAQILGMVDSALQSGPQIVIFASAGINDMVQGRSIAETSANVREIKSRIRARGAVPIQVAPARLPAQYKQADGIHPSAAGQSVIASGVLPQVLAALRGRR